LYVKMKYPTQSRRNRTNADTQRERENPHITIPGEIRFPK
jgi:hypothetical protein